MGEVLRWAVALTVYPFLLAHDLIFGDDEEQWLREQEEMFRRRAAERGKP